MSVFPNGVYNPTSPTGANLMDDPPLSEQLTGLNNEVTAIETWLLAGESGALINVAAPTGIAATDTASINVAIEAANENVFAKGILFQGGLYVTNGNHNIGGGSPGALAIVAAGWNTEIQLANAANTYIFIFDTVGSAAYTPGAFFKGMYLNCNGANQTTAGGGIYAGGAVWCLFDHLWIEAPWEAGIRFYEDGTGNYGHHNTIRDCLIKDGKLSNGGEGWALKLDHADENRMIDCTFQDCGNNIGSGHDAQIYDTSAGLQRFIGCDWVNGGENVPMFLSDSTPGRCSFASCNFDSPTGNTHAVELNGPGHEFVACNWLNIGNSSSGGPWAGININGTSDITVNNCNFAGSSSTYSKAIIEQSGSNSNIIGFNTYTGSWVGGYPLTTVGDLTFVATNLPTRTFNIANYGAVGDGSTDDTAAIQACFTAATITGGTIYIDTGTSGGDVFIVNGSLTLTDATKINIRGTGTLKLKSAATAQTAMLALVGCTYITIRDLTFDKNGSNQTEYTFGIYPDVTCAHILCDNITGINIDGFMFQEHNVALNTMMTDLSVSNSRFLTIIGGAPSDVCPMVSYIGSFSNNYVEGNGYMAIYVYESDYYTVVGNTVKLKGQAGGGIVVGSSPGTTVVGNTVLGSTNDLCISVWIEVDNDWARPMTDCVVSGNNMIAASAGACQSLSLQSCTNVSITGNVFDGGYCGIVIQSTGTGVSDCTVTGNVFANIGGGGPLWITGPAPTNFHMSNNTGYNSTLVTSAPGATPSIDTDLHPVVHFTGLAAAITSLTTNLTGTPQDGDTLRISFTDNGTARAIAHGSLFEAGDTISLATTTVAGVRLDETFYWNTETSKWRITMNTAQQPATVPSNFMPNYLIVNNSGAATANLLYTQEIFVPFGTTLNGGAWGNNSTVAGDILVGLYNAAGTLVASSASTSPGSGYSSGVAAFSTAYAAAPGKYFIGIMASSASQIFDTGIPFVPCSTAAQGTFALPTTITPPGTYTAGGSLYPMVSTY